MKFPITRTELQQFDYTLEIKQKRERDVDKKIEEILERLCKEFEKFIQTYHNEQKFIWTIGNNKSPYGIFTEIFEYIRYYNIGDIQEDKLSLFDSKKKYLINKIRNLFIGCDIIIDPLQTYIIIDWS